MSLKNMLADFVYAVVGTAARVENAPDVIGATTIIDTAIQQGAIVCLHPAAPAQGSLAPPRGMA